MNQLVTDIRSGLRMLVKYPMLPIVAILTFGPGIGLSTTVFCVVSDGLPAAGNGTIPTFPLRRATSPTVFASRCVRKVNQAPSRRRFEDRKSVV